jgi:shikimate dehydrogenase
LQQVGVEVYHVTRGEKTQPAMFRYDELNAYVLDAFRLVVNTTPLGMYPQVEECPAIPYEYLTPGHICYDLIYNPDETLFLSKAKAMGAVTINGLNMLRLQAEKSWEIWQA